MAIFAEITENERVIDRHLRDIHTLLDYDASEIKTAITPPRRGLVLSNLVQSFNTSQAIHYEGSRSKDKGQGHWVKVQLHSVT